MTSINAVQKMVTAAYKLLFPHITYLDALTPEDTDHYNLIYRVQCLEPVVKRRGIIHEQYHMIDKKYIKEMPVFVIEEFVLSAN